MISVVMGNKDDQLFRQSSNNFQELIKQNKTPINFLIRRIAQLTRIKYLSHCLQFD